MKRTPILVLVLPLALSSVVGAVSAPTYAATTCHGLPVTIQGTPGGQVEGTPGNDVIDSNGSTRVSAGAGDDTICQTTTGHVEAGDGNDYVEATSAGDQVSAVLGAGSDTYRGGTAFDLVAAGESPAGPLGLPDLGGNADTESDDIDTGAGGDVVVSGHDGLPNGDRLVLGDGDDQLYLRGTTAAVDPGSGVNQLVPGTDPADPSPFGLDTRAGALTRQGTPVWSIPGFTEFRLRGFALAGPATIRGSKADEDFNLFDRPSGGPVDIAAGGGDDDILLGAGDLGDLAGQGGRDELRLVGTFGGNKKALGRIDLRLDRGRATVTVAGQTQRSRVTGFESVTSIGFYTATAAGSARSELIRLGGACHISIDGGGGDDTLVHRNTTNCRAGTGQARDEFTRVRGGPGDDTLIGSPGPDLLLGDSGRDRADGRLGIDRCVAEIRTGCEKS